MPVMLMIWLLLTVVAPHQDTYKAFFYLIMVPTGCIIFFSGRAGINWKDPFLRVSLVFFAYAGITTFLVGLGPIESHLRALRWSIEISIGLVFLYLWMPVVVRDGERWGRILLFIALSGGLAAIIAFLLEGNLSTRLTGLGVDNPIQISSVLMIYFALGQFLLNSCCKQLSRFHIALLLGAFVVVFFTVLLSKSRGPLLAMLVYALFIGLMFYVRKPKRMINIGVTVVLATITVLALLQYFYGLEYLVDGLISMRPSYRIAIWTGYLQHPQDSLLFGAGAGTPHEYHPATEAFWKPNNIKSWHPHNLFLGTWVDTGFVGLGFLLVLIWLVIRSINAIDSGLEQKIRLMGILGLIFMLTLTGSQTVISSIKAIWLFLWFPVIFILFWSKQNTGPPEDNEAL